jgi:hypothetical protein
MLCLCVTDGGLNSRVILTCAELRTTSVPTAEKNSKRHQTIASSVAREWIRTVTEMYEELVKRLRNISNSDSNIKSNYIGLTMIQAADAIEELSKPKWIPVTERWPEERMAVIVYAPYMKNEFMAYWTGSRWMVWAAGEYEREMPEYHQITHWMPLPEPPKEET